MIEKIDEEGIILTHYDKKISKELDVFYNPLMKLNRDISLLVIKSFFKQPIIFCDPMGASAIRELRFLKTIPECFEKIIIGDISQRAIDEMQKNFKENDISTEKVEFMQANAINTISKQYYDFIEIDPFGSPIPFLDIAMQRIKHYGILSVTATDTAALCGTYPKTTLRKYNIKNQMTLAYNEIGLRNLIAYCQVQSAKYEKVLKPLISYSIDHYYKIFFQVTDSRTEAYEMIKDLKWIEYDSINQDYKVHDNEICDNLIGKTFVKDYTDKEFIEKLISNSDMIKDNKKLLNILEKLKLEPDNIPFYKNIHKLQKSQKTNAQITFNELLEEIHKENHKAQKVHNDNVSIKTSAPTDIIVKILKKYSKSS